jgi:hypothetical protein
MTTTTYSGDSSGSSAPAKSALAHADTKGQVKLATRDWVIVGFLGFFILMAYTIELYFVVYHDQLVARSATDFFAKCYAVYGAGDNAYFGKVTALTRSLEGINIFCTQFLNAWLIYAILKAKPYRHVLQLGVAAYLSYSVILYFWSAHISGYENMAVKNAWAYFIFYVPNLPWLLAHLYMVYDSSVSITRRFASTTA